MQPARIGSDKGQASTRTQQRAALPLSSAPIADPAIRSILSLQRACGNQAGNHMLQRVGAGCNIQYGRQIQRAIWTRNLFPGNIEQRQEGPAKFPLSTDVLAKILQPGDSYDDATGIITRLGGGQEVVSTTESATSSGEAMDTASDSPSSSGESHRPSVKKREFEGDREKRRKRDQRLR